jgi:hypothetical protein
MVAEAYLVSLDILHRRLFLCTRLVLSVLSTDHDHTGAIPTICTSIRPAENRKSTTYKAKGATPIQYGTFFKKDLNIIFRAVHGM